MGRSKSHATGNVLEVWNAGKATAILFRRRRQLGQRNTDAPGFLTWRLRAQRDREGEKEEANGKNAKKMPGENAEHSLIVAQRALPPE